MNLLLLAAVSGALAGLTACSIAPTSPQTSAIRQLAQAHGGLSADPALQQQAETLLDAVASTRDTTARLSPRIRVLSSPRPLAFAVAPRDVFVSEGLLRLATTDQAAAAVAHELGHLMESETGIVSALVGQTGMECPEARADRYAVELLTKTSYDPDAMRSLLALLNQHVETDSALNRHLTQRHDLLLR